MKLNRISLSKLNDSILDKQQQKLIIGGGCKCGSCGEWATSDANLDANWDGGITGTGTNDPVCACHGELTADYIASLYG